MSEKKSKIKKYILGLVVAFAAGTAVGTYFSKDIMYAKHRVDRTFISVDQGLRKRSPEVVTKYDNLMQKLYFGRNEEETKQARKDCIDQLDQKIKTYEESKK